MMMVMVMRWMVVKKVGLDDVIAGDCEKNIDPGHVYSDGGDSKDDDGVDDIGAGDNNGGDDDRDGDS